MVRAVAEWTWVRVSLLILVTALVPGPARAVSARVPGEVVVKLRSGLDRAAAAHLASRHGSSLRRMSPHGDLALVALPPGLAVDDAIARLRSDPACAWSEPNFRGRGGGFVPDDPRFPLEWHLQNTGQTGGTPGADVEATEAWTLTRGSSEVVVAVLDTGIDSDHAEFAGRLLPGYDFVNGDADPEADHPHGVLVTGILAANADNGIEVAGVDQRALILPVKVLGADNTGTTFDLAQGLEFAADQGADVINLSLIDYPPDSKALNDALQYAYDHGAVLIACAGNGGLGDADRSAPGVSPLTISVGLTDATDARADFPQYHIVSATGSALDLVAPGWILASVSSSAGAFFSGCSAATPVVSGIASLMLARDPALTPDEVREVLTSTAEDQVGPPAQDTPGRDDFFGYGRANAYRAVLAVPEAPAGAPVVLALAWLAQRRRRRSR
jgi:subtilisin family serine protease